MKLPERSVSEAPWLSAASLANAELILGSYQRTWGTPLVPQVRW